MRAAPCTPEPTRARRRAPAGSRSDRTGPGWPSCRYALPSARSPATRSRRATRAPPSAERARPTTSNRYRPGGTSTRREVCISSGRSSHGARRRSSGTCRSTRAGGPIGPARRAGSQASSTSRVARRRSMSGSARRPPASAAYPSAPTARPRAPRHRASDAAAASDSARSGACGPPRTNDGSRPSRSSEGARTRSSPLSPSARLCSARGASAATATMARPTPARAAAASRRARSAGARASASAGSAGTTKRAGGQAPPHHMLNEAPVRKVAPPSSAARAASPGRHRASAAPPARARTKTGAISRRPNCRSRRSAAAPHGARAGETSAAKPGPYAADSEARP